MTPALVVPVLGRKLYPGASVALDFTRNLYRSGTPVVKGSPSLLSGWTFARASTGYAETAAGALVAFASGAPRITDKGLLVEEARTNLALQSQTLGSWTTSTATVSADAKAAPDGTITMDRFIPDTGTSGIVYQITAVTANSTVYTASCYVDMATAPLSQFTFYFGYTGVLGADRTGVTVTTATPSLADFTAGAGTAPTSKSITLITGTIYRIVFTFTSGTVGASAMAFRATGGDADGTKGVAIWGAQLEAGTFPTSYIPTTTASATRAADVAYIDSAAAYNAAAGTLFGEYSNGPNQASSVPVASWDNGDGNTDCLRVGASSGATSTRSDIRSGNAGVAGWTLSTFTAGAVVKVAASIALDDMNAAGNGILGTRDTSAALPTNISRLTIGRSNQNGLLLCGYIRRVVYYPAAFSDAALQALTT